MNTNASSLPVGSTLRMTRPDDWHLHVRDGAMLAAVLPQSAAQFARAIIMPNLQPPIVNVRQAQDYRLRLMAALPLPPRFEPLMTLYLTEETPPDEVRRAKKTGIAAFKLYPAGATTNSRAGVRDLQRVYPVLEAMQHEGVPLLLHAEVTDPQVDVYDREAMFITRQLAPLRRDFPELRIVFEHITTREAAQYVRAADDFLGATITAHHLLLNRNALFEGGLRPHCYCRPLLKREKHRQALVAAATSGSPRFFLGTDSAPHPTGAKETDCGCAGCYTALGALALYAKVFEAAGALDKLEGFASHHGPDFYGLPRNKESITLRKKPWRVPEHVECSDGKRVRPLFAGEMLEWSVDGVSFEPTQQTTATNFDDWQYKSSGATPLPI